MTREGNAKRCFDRAKDQEARSSKVGLKKNIYQNEQFLLFKHIRDFHNASFDTE